MSSEEMPDPAQVSSEEKQKQNRVVFETPEPEQIEEEEKSGTEKAVETNDERGEEARFYKRPQKPVYQMKSRGGYNKYHGRRGGAPEPRG